MTKRKSMDATIWEAEFAKTYYRDGFRAGWLDAGLGECLAYSAHFSNLPRYSSGYVDGQNARRALREGHGETWETAFEKWGKK